MNLNWFQNNLDLVYFFYGISLLISGVATLVQPKERSEFKFVRILWLFSLFAITHGISELINMWEIVRAPKLIWESAGMFLLVISYISLFEFGRHLCHLTNHGKSGWRRNLLNLLKWWSPATIVIFIVVFGFISNDILETGKTWTRYLLGFPGGIMVGYGFYSYYKYEKHILRTLKIKKYFISAGISIFSYGILSGLIVSHGDFFPASWLNTTSFLLTTGIPVEVFCAFFAIAAAWSVTGTLKIFRWESLCKLRDLQLNLTKQLDEVTQAYMYIYENSNDGIHSCGANGFILFANKKICELLGYSKDELVGEHFRKLYPAEVWEDVILGFEKLKREGWLFVKDGLVVKRNGEKLNVEIHSSAVYDNKGKFVRTSTITKDITGRVIAQELLDASEKEYKNLVDNALVGVYKTNLSGDILYVNEALVKMLEYESLEQMSQLRAFETYKDPKYREILISALKQKDKIRDFEVELITKNGNIKNVILSASLIGEKIEGMVLDISERVNMQAQIIQSAKMSSIGLLTSGIAHELNNPLTAVIGNAQLLLNETLKTSRQYEDIKDIEEAAKRCKNIVSQLLLFSRQASIKFENVDINKTVENAVRMVVRQIDNGKIKIVRRYADNLPLILGSNQQLEQVFINLIMNSKDAMPAGGTLKISTVLAGDKIEISFTDNGIGISKKIAGRIFDPFFTTKPVGTGTGLGLSVCKGIVEKHKGIVDFQSVEDKGTTFTIILPVPLTG